MTLIEGETMLRATSARVAVTVIGSKLYVCAVSLCAKRNKGISNRRIMRIVVFMMQIPFFVIWNILWLCLVHRLQRTGVVGSPNNSCYTHHDGKRDLRSATSHDDDLSMPS